MQQLQLEVKMTPDMNLVPGNKLNRTDTNGQCQQFQDLLEMLLAPVAGKGQSPAVKNSPREEGQENGADEEETLPVLSALFMESVPMMVADPAATDNGASQQALPDTAVTGDAMPQMSIVDNSSVLPGGNVQIATQEVNKDPLPVADAADSELSSIPTTQSGAADGEKALNPAQADDSRPGHVINAAPAAAVENAKSFKAQAYGQEKSPAADKVNTQREATGNSAQIQDLSAPVPQDAEPAAGDSSTGQQAKMPAPMDPAASDRGPGRRETKLAGTETVSIQNQENQISASTPDRTRTEKATGPTKAQSKVEIADQLYFSDNTGSVSNTAREIKAENAPRLELPRTQVDSIVSSVIQNVKNTPTSVEISLKPEYLGKMELHLQSHAGQISVRITAHSEETVNMLNASLASIRDNLEQQGIKLQQIQVDISYQGSQGNHPQSSSEEHSRRSRPEVTPQAREVLENLEDLSPSARQLNILA